jgi:2,3-bisphosphoglycerate-dependent phosphoglycerate mutase
VVAVESLKDLIVRTVPYFTETILPTVRAGQRVLLVAHGTSLRGIVKHVEGLSDQEVSAYKCPDGLVAD